jgi:uncharacterized low-complexity protein
MSKSPAKPVALAVAAALGGIALSGAAFSMTPLAAGYMVSAQDAGDAAAAAKESEGRCGIARADSDGDGRLSAQEFAAAHAEKDPSYFTTMDSNGDGFVDQAEHDAHHATMDAGSGDHDKAGQEGKCGEGKCGGGGACGGVA